MEKFAKLKHWEDTNIYKPVVSRIRKQFGLTGVSISLITKSRVCVKFETKLEFRDIPRMVLLDSHAILSREGLLLTDAATDWRFSKSPFVTKSPKIRFYCGVHLVTSSGINIGVLALYDSYTRMSFSEKSVDQLADIASDFMDVLETPYEKILEQRSNKLKELTNVIDAELIELSFKLGRATSKGNYITVYERDGSGHPYAQNRNFQVSKVDLLDTELTANTMPESEKLCLHKKLVRASSVAKALEKACKYIALSHGADFVCIVEVRLAESRSIAAKYWPKDATKVALSTFKHANKLNKGKDQDRAQAKVVAASNPDVPLSGFIDGAIAHKILKSEFGFSYSSHEHEFLRGILMPFHQGELRMSAKPNDADKLTMDVQLKTSGYLIGVFNKSERKVVSPTGISKIFDHAAVLRSVLSK